MLPEEMCIRETRFFIPHSDRFEPTNPSPNVVGYLLRPLTGVPYLEWFWFTRYLLPPDDADHNDCDPYNFPSNYYWINNDKQYLWSYRFRYCLSCIHQKAFEQTAEEIFVHHSCISRYFRDYSLVDDLGGSRFTGVDNKRERRAEIVCSLVHATSQLVLDALQGPDENGNFCLETVTNETNAFGVSHHLFCNITGEPECI